MFCIEASDKNSSPIYHNFTRCGACGYAALYFDGSGHVAGLQCYFGSDDLTIVDLRQPDDLCDKV